MNKKREIAIVTCMHGRPLVTEIFLNGLAYLKASLPWANITVNSAVTEGDVENIELCKRFGVKYVETQNKQLGRKWNTALSLVQDTSAQHILIMGSDDLIAPELLNIYLPLMIEGCKYMGVRDLYFVDMDGAEACYFMYPPMTGRTVGAGRMISRDVVDECNFILWQPDINTNLDSSLDLRLHRKGYMVHQVENHRGMVVDLKTKDNIWPFSRFISPQVGAIPVRQSDALWWCIGDLRDRIKNFNEDKYRYGR